MYVNLSQLINKTFLIVSLFSILSCSHSIRKNKELAVSKPYNILMIAIDDLNTWTGHLGTHPNSITPNIDRLANEGVSFRNAFAAAPACKPSRTAITTGIRPHRSGVYQNADDDMSILKLHETIPAYLARHGYKTLSSGKIFHGRKINPLFFQHNYVNRGNYSSKVRLNDLDELSGNFDWGPLDVDKDLTPDMDIAKWAKTQLSQKHEKPFFMALGIFRPHLPWLVPKEYFDKFPIEEIELPRGVLENDLDDIPHKSKPNFNDHRVISEAGKWKEGVQAYLASVNYADEVVGRIYDALLNSEYRDNTIVVLWGDHGWQLGEKRHWRKFQLWSAASRTSYIYKLPRQYEKKSIPRGEIVDAPVDLMSIFPTLTSLTDLPRKPGIDGKDISQLIVSQESEWKDYALTSQGPNEHAIRYKNWSFLRYPDGSQELYDLKQDPHEWHNLANDRKYRHIIAKLSAFLPRNAVAALEKADKTP